jgi:hypothetical protein
MRFHRVPGLDCRWEAHAWLFERGCSLHTHVIYLGCDGLWRGSGMEAIG